MIMLHQLLAVVALTICVCHASHDTEFNETERAPVLGLRASPVYWLDVAPFTGGIDADLPNDRALCVQPPPFGEGQCAVHKEDALERCLALDGCLALQCLPEPNYAFPGAALPIAPLRRRTASGELIGDSPESERLRAAAASGDVLNLEVERAPDRSSERASENKTRAPPIAVRARPQTQSAPPPLFPPLPGAAPPAGASFWACL